MSREIIRETHVASSLRAGAVETVIERVFVIELVTEDIGPPGRAGADGDATLRRDLDRIDDLSLLFDNGLI